MNATGKNSLVFAVRALENAYLLFTDDMGSEAIEVGIGTSLAKGGQCKIQVYRIRPL
jgi:hypothetical protein